MSLPMSVSCYKSVEMGPVVVDTPLLVNEIQTVGRSLCPTLNAQ